MRQRPALAKLQRIIRAVSGRLKHRQRRQTQVRGPPRKELDFTRRRGVGVIGISVMRYIERADAACIAQFRDSRIARCRVIQHRVEKTFVRRPGKEFRHIQSLREILQHLTQRVRFSRRRQRLLHEIQMGVGHFAPQLLQPRCRRQHDMRVLANGVVAEQIVAHQQFQTGQTF